MDEAPGYDHDAYMRGFYYMKAIIARYGVQAGADLLVLADRLVDRAMFPTRRAAIEGIEAHMGLSITTPISDEGIAHNMRERAT